MNRGKKRKGRPPKNKVLISEAVPEKPSIPDSALRSVRRNPSQSQLHSEDDYEYGDDDDERMEKKVKLVVRLPNESAEEKTNEKVRNSSSEDAEMVKKETRSSEAAADAPLCGLTTPLPDKNLLIFILDRLQKKDTYGVFSKPVDPEELPDYFEVIEKPMDFETVRKKLNGGVYSKLEELEADVFLICSNAMQYNSSDTIYHRQARTIQELAKRDFENLKHEGEDGEPQPKVVRRGRPPSSKNKNKIVEEKPPVESSPGAADRVGFELSSAGADDKAAYNLRKASTPYKFQATDAFASLSRSRFGENHNEWTSDWSDFPAHILRADMKYGKKSFTVDETRRDTYRPLHPPSAVSSNNIEDLRRLVPIGLQDPLAYARSLARFSANLGPVAWKIASRKIEYVLPPGMKYGPGWVGENPSSTNMQPYSFSANKQKLPSNITVSPPNFGINSAQTHVVPSNKMVEEGAREMNNQRDESGRGDSSSWRALLLAQQNPYKNGVSTFGHNSNLSVPRNPRMAVPGNSASGSSAAQMVMKESEDDDAKLQENQSPAPANLCMDTVDSLGGGGARNSDMGMWKSSPSQQQMCSKDPISAPPPDLNVRIPAGSPGSSSLQIGSSPTQQQPDLALQL